MNEGREGEAGAARPVVYCLLPTDLAPRLHDTLRRHFRDEPSVEVIVDRRRGDRRGREERRAEAWPAAAGLSDHGDVASRVGTDGELSATPEAEKNRGTRGESSTRSEIDNRRAIRSAGGRRAGERRAELVPVEAPVELPRRARVHAERIHFVERLEPSTERLEDLDTARLVSRFQGGDREAFATLYTRYFDRIYGYLRVAMRRQHEAEDLAQQVFTQVFEALPRYERRSQPFRAWLFAVARNHAVTALRRSSRLELAAPEELDRRRDEARETELHALSWVSDRDLLVFIERLPLAQRQVLALRFLYGFNTDEIAQVLERTATDVRGLQHRALKFLRHRLEAVGTERPARGQARMRTRHKQAPVLRFRRFALRAP